MDKIRPNRLTHRHIEHIDYVFYMPMFFHKIIIVFFILSKLFKNVFQSQEFLLQEPGKDFFKHRSPAMLLKKVIPRTLY